MIDTCGSRCKSASPLTFLRVQRLLMRHAGANARPHSMSKFPWKYGFPNALIPKYMADPHTGRLLHVAPCRLLSRPDQDVQPNVHFWVDFPVNYIAAGSSHVAPSVARYFQHRSGNFCRGTGSFGVTVPANSWWHGLSSRVSSFSSRVRPGLKCVTHGVVSVDPANEYRASQDDRCIGV